MPVPRPLPSRVENAHGWRRAPVAIALLLTLALAPQAWAQTTPIPDRFTTTQS
jgi:hypothetical protein